MKVEFDKILEDKHADIKSWRENDFHYAWELAKGKTLCVERVPDNWPALNVWIDTRPLSKIRKSLKKIGFEMEK